MEPQAPPPEQHTPPSATPPTHRAGGYAAAEVLLPVAAPGTYTYLLPDDLPHPPQVGQRVVVTLGKSRAQAGVIVRLLTLPHRDAAHELKYIRQQLDEHPVVTQPLLDLCLWMAEYYLCTPGEALKAALPTGLKVDSLLRVELSENPLPPAAELSEPEALLVDALSFRAQLNLVQVQEIWNRENVLPALRQAAARGLVYLYEEAREKSRPRTERYLQWAPAYRSATGQEMMWELVKKAPRQQEALQVLVPLLAHTGRLSLRDLEAQEELNPNQLKALRDKGIIEVVHLPLSRLKGDGDTGRYQPVTLTAAQTRALNELNTLLAQNPKRPVLLHGITGSGKTYLYIELLRRVLASGKQALYLLPEIGLTRQIIDRLRLAFGAQVGVYHSKFSPGERVEIWRRVLDGTYKLVVGVRSALMLPFDNLGAIVVDEEHDTSFKQQEPNPRYHARDAALWLGHRLGIPVVLGSATPSLETYRHAQTGKYGLVELHERPVQATLPEIITVDMRLETKHRLSQGPFSSVLIEALHQVLSRGEQAILFKNRRGYSPVVVCNSCGSVARCKRCDISLTYHKRTGQRRCHYCGYTEKGSLRCGVCHKEALRLEGMGTERVEEHLQELFPTARIGRMDHDTTRGKSGSEPIIRQLEAGELDFLVGTQMVTKGLDFERVTLAAVLNADTLIGYPDFRAHEYAYQLLTQFAGRAGRSDLGGRVIIQTRQIGHPVIRLLNEPYKQFFEYELPHRSGADYPPFVRLLRLTFLHKDADRLETEGSELARYLKAQFGFQILGPEYPPVARVMDMYRLQMLLKIKPTQSLAAVRKGLKQSLAAYYQRTTDHSLRVELDMDPR